MLDLKAKLLQAGLVTEEQVQKAESDEAEARAKKAARHGGARPKGKGSGKGKGKGNKGGGPQSDDERWQKRVAELKEAPKSDQYDAIRGWVARTRLDQAKGLPSENAERFHFTKHDGHISWLTLEPPVKQALSEGKAGIIAFMSHNGLAHCVVPREVALDVGQVRPEWVRHLDGFAVETRAPSDEKASDEGAGDDSTSAESASAESASDERAGDASDSGPSAGSPPPEAT